MVTRLHCPALPEPHRRPFAGWWQPVVCCCCCDITKPEHANLCAAIYYGTVVAHAAGVCSPERFPYVLHMRAHHSAAH